MRIYRRTAAVLAVLGVAAGVAASAVHAAPLRTDWVQQDGATSYDIATGVSIAPNGSIFVAGTFSGTMDGGGSPPGEDDDFVAKYDATGNRLWRVIDDRQHYNQNEDVAATADGGAYVVGTYQTTANNMPSDMDIVVRKYSTSGELVWRRTLGDPVENDYGSSIAVTPEGGVVFAGLTDGEVGGAMSQGGRDVVVAKYSASGQLQWTDQRGSNDQDMADDIVVLPGGDLRVGTTMFGAKYSAVDIAGASDGFVLRYNGAGSYDGFSWITSPGADYVHEMTVGSDGAFYVAGVSDGTLFQHQPVGGFDGYVTRYEAGGGRTWTQWFATTSADIVTGVAPAPGGGIDVAGFTLGSLGRPNLGSSDAFVARLSTGGAVGSTHQFGTKKEDVVRAIAPGPVVVGGSSGPIAGHAPAGDTDHFVALLTTEPLPPGAPPPLGSPISENGYWMVGADGAVYSFGGAGHFGSPIGQLGFVPAVDLEPTASYQGYWIVDAAGRVWSYGDAGHFGNVDVSALAPGETTTSIAGTKSGQGYWVFTNRGRVLTFGDAVFHGDMSNVALNGPVLDSITTPSGQGYYMVASDGGVFSFGDAAFFGSMGGTPLNKPVESLVPDPDGVGYWLVASDGGVFAFEAGFRGSMGATPLNKPVTGMVAFGNGYLMVAEDGGIFTFSDKPFYGSLGANPPAIPITNVAPSMG